MTTFDEASANIMLAITDLLAMSPAETDWIADIRADIDKAIIELAPDAILEHRLRIMIDIAASHPHIPA